MLVTYEHLFLEIFLRTCLYYAKLCTHFKSHSHKRARTLQRGLVFRQFKLFCLQTASSIDFGQIVEPVNCMIRPTLIVIYLGFKEAWTVKVLHFYEANFAPIWMLLPDYLLSSLPQVFLYRNKYWFGIQTASIDYFDLFVDLRTLPALALPFNKHKFCSPLNATPWLLSS